MLSQHLRQCDARDIERQFRMEARCHGRHGRESSRGDRDEERGAHGGGQHIISVLEGDVVQIGMQTLDIGKSSCTLACDVRSIQGNRVVCSIDKMVYVRVNKYGLPKAHGGMDE